jgi:2-keto-4-pentenoate hydratase/2-oxohepta-3-ene-1,7-dioic acid hydratase in catechol pathway
MKILRFSYRGRENFGVLDDQKIRLFEGSPFNFRLLEKTVELKAVKLLAPVKPSKIVAVGLNYLDHAQELGMSVPSEPIIFLKPPSSIIGPNEPIIYPKMSKQVDFEAELAVVIKERAKNITPQEAPHYILGFTCSNDITARDLQRKDNQWTRAKSFDTFSPIGPWIETELEPDSVAIELYINGERKQCSSTSKMIFDCYFLTAFISQIMTLLPGDIIMTGTPPGVGPLEVGDLIEVKIEGIGSLVNRVIV